MKLLSLCEARRVSAGRAGRGARRPAPTLIVQEILTPLGPMVAAADTEHLYLLEFAVPRRVETQLTNLSVHLRCCWSAGRNRVIAQTEREITEYFAGTRRVFSIPHRLLGTEFQREIWQLVRKIPYGATSSYKRLAVTAGRPRSQRAVGRANGGNRLAIVIPCHRVVGSDGAVCGYGGGAHRKQWLLRHESNSLSSTTEE